MSIYLDDIKGGRLEPLKISTVGDDGHGYAAATGPEGETQLIRALNVGPYENQTVLVRYSRELSPGTRFSRYANLISSAKSEMVKVGKGLAWGEYLLYGVWDPEWKMMGDVPTHAEVERHFQPADMPWLLYVLDDSTDREGRYTIYLRKTASPEHKTLENSLKYALPRKPRFVKVVLGQSKVALEEVLETAIKLGMQPIEMESIRVVAE